MDNFELGTPEDWVVIELRPISYLLRATRYEATSVVSGNTLDILPDDYFITGIRKIKDGYTSSVYVHKYSPWGEQYNPDEVK